MIQLRLLGSVDLLGDDGARMDAAMRRPKVVAVLAYLAAARPRGFHRRDKIAALFWPELSAERARAALRVTLTRLRDDIGADVIVSRNSDEISVDASRLACDVAALDDALARGDVSAAAALYRGPLMDGVHVEGTAEELEQWVSIERTRVRQEMLRALTAAAEGEVRRGAHAGAVVAARLATEIAPEDEGAHRALIVAQLAGGDRGGALHVYEELSRRLARDFGVLPSLETRALVNPVKSDGGAPHREMQQSAAETVVAAALPGRSRARLVIRVGLAAAVVFVAGAVVEPDWGFTSPPPAAVRWSMVKEVSSLRPRGRIESGAVLDSTRNAIVVFGGQSYGDDPATSRNLNELWRLRGLRAGETPMWSRLEWSGGAAPAPRWLFGMTYDAAHDRALVHGGALGFTSPCANDTWILDHASGVGASPSWRRVAIRGPRAPVRAGMRIAYDANARRMIFFGGHDCISVFSRDVWVLAFDDSSLAAGRWIQLRPDSSAGAPLGRSAYGAAYDAAANRLFIHGGASGGNVLGELWLLENANGVGGTPAWRLLHCAGDTPVRGSESAIYDPASASMVIFGGVDAAQDYHHDLWRVTGLSGSASGCRWEPLQSSEPLPAPRGGAIGMFDPASRTALFFGGHFQTTGLSDTWIVADPFKK